LANNKEELEKTFWRGLFDTDGCHKKEGRSVNLSSANKSFLLECKKCLMKNKITPSKLSKGKRGYTMSIHSYDLFNFAKMIGFSHPRKRGYLLKYLKNKQGIERTFIKINKQNMFKDFFDLNTLPIRVYNAHSLFKKYLKANNLSQRKAAIILQTWQSAIFDWHRGRSGIPLRKLIELAKIGQYTKLDVYNELTKISNLRFCLIKGKGRGKSVKLPLKPNKKLLFIAKYTRPSTHKLHIRNKIKGKKTPIDNVLEEVKQLFEVDSRKQQDGIYRIDSLTLARFFREFFIYKPVWNPISQSTAKELKNIWSNL